MRMQMTRGMMSRSLQPGQADSPVPRNEQGGGTQFVAVDHKGQRLAFDARTYAKTSDRSSSVDTETMFDEFNAYVATLPEEVQDELFAQYRLAYDGFERLQGNLDGLTQYLIDCVAVIFRHLEQDAIRAWIINRSHIRIPSTMQDQFNPEDAEDIRKRTYLRTDYLDLATFALSLRSMVPLWGQYIHVSEETSGSTLKEYVALELLYKTNLHQTRAFERLSVYIRAFIDSEIKPDAPKAAPILTSVGSQDLPPLLLSQAIVRRLSVGELSSANEGSHIITNLYQYILNAVRSLDRKFGKQFSGKIKDKKETIRNSKATDEQSVSVVEMYKIVQPISDGDVGILSVYTERMLEMALRVEPNLDLELLKKCVAAISSLETEAILDHQVTLAQWIIHKVMSPKAGQSLNKAAILRTIAVSQAILWHWGLHELAGLITATRLPTNQNAVGFGYAESRVRLKADMIDEFSRMTPHLHTVKRSRNSNSGKTQTAAARSIEAFCDLVRYTDWRLNCPEELLPLIPGRIERSRKMLVPGDLRIQLGKLLIRVNEGQY